MKRMKPPIYKQFYVKSILARLFGTPSSSGLWALSLPTDHDLYPGWVIQSMKVNSHS